LFYNKGTVHYQGYCEFLRPYGLADVKSRVSETAHWEVRRGTAKQAIKYSNKAETREEGPWTFGEPTAQGKRNDILALRDAIKGGCTSKSILLEDHGTCIAKYPRFAAQCMEAYFVNGWRKVKVILLYGNTGLGKTRWVYDNWMKDEQFWRLPAVTSQCWFDGYEGQTHVLLDDFSGAPSKISVNLLLQMVDGYFQRLPTKGGFTGFRATHIAITTNVHPRDWYKWSGRENQYYALARRFTGGVKDFQKVDGDVVVTEYEASVFFGFI